MEFPSKGYKDGNLQVHCHRYSKARHHAKIQRTQEQMGKRVTEICQSGEGSKASSKVLRLQRTAMRAISHKQRKRGTVVNLPRSGRPTKITPRAQRRLIQEVTTDPTTTSKEPQASPASVKVSVHDSTIRKRLGKNYLHGRVPRPKPRLSKKNRPPTKTLRLGTEGIAQRGSTETKGNPEGAAECPSRDWRICPYEHTKPSTPQSWALVTDAYRQKWEGWF
ncbi:hypothetical protein NFI96_003252 [Prochilodus magdalenae]|nr:hypothetical protein NFI96_003252 [Prochilodus magdalenae]